MSTSSKPATPAGASFEPLAVLRSRWRLVLLTTVVSLGAALAYGFLAPKWYIATLAVVPVPPQKMGGMLAGGGAAAGLAAGLDLPFDMGLGSSDAERIAGVLRSATVSDAVIEKFNLMARYRERYWEDASKQLWKHCSTKIEKKPAIVSLTCEDKDPATVKAMVDFFANHGNQVFREISHSTAGEERRFLARRVGEARRDMDDAARKLRDFQEKNKVIDLPEQSKAVVSMMASLKAELLSKQIQRSYLGGFSSGDESSANQLQRQIAIIGAKLQSLEESRLMGTPSEVESGPKAGPKAVVAKRGGKADGAELFPRAMSVPKLRYELEQLFREQKIQEAVFLMLTQRYENARVGEARDTSTFQVLDRPRLPSKKTRPKRLLYAVLGLIAGLGAGLVLVLGPAWWLAFVDAGRRE